jgi:hypothetical protein
MLRIIVPASEFFNVENSEFIYYPEEILELEHSLVSISKWESKWHKPFLSETKKTVEEILYYIQCMCINEHVDTRIFNRLTNNDISAINEYIDDPMTATTFNETKGGGSREVVTSEIIYYWMITLNIPFECQDWHINRLLTLIKVCNIKNSPEKKMSKQEILERNKRLNAERRRKLNTKG